MHSELLKALRYYPLANWAFQRGLWIGISLGVVAGAALVLTIMGGR